MVEICTLGQTQTIHQDWLCTYGGVGGNSGGGRKKKKKKSSFCCRFRSLSHLSLLRQPASFLPARSSSPFSRSIFLFPTFSLAYTNTAFFSQSVFVVPSFSPHLDTRILRWEEAKINSSALWEEEKKLSPTLHPRSQTASAAIAYCHCDIAAEHRPSIHRAIHLSLSSRLSVAIYKSALACVLALEISLPYFPLHPWSRIKASNNRRTGKDNLTRVSWQNNLGKHLKLLGWHRRWGCDWRPQNSPLVSKQCRYADSENYLVKK